MAKIPEGIAARMAGASAETADPARAERNLARVLEAVYARASVDETGLDEVIGAGLPALARVCSMSQFLSNHSVVHPGDVAWALGMVRRAADRAVVEAEADAALALDPSTDEDAGMRMLREFKRRMLLWLTLRFVSGRADILVSMVELSVLADVIVDRALRWVAGVMERRHGATSNEGGLCVVALGKLGGMELNYSSDIDVIAVYADGEGETAGVTSATGVLMNRISNHEFHCKTVETLGRVLSRMTGEGFAYRVDLRLRPQGQKGDAALPLSAYQAYYATWGRTWERMVLLRARPCAGDAEVGRAFMRIIEPFVWKPLDYAEIEEIRALKKKIDSVVSRDDIKRGYGGIREAEFFVQTFQLIYGGQNPAFRTYRMFDAVQALARMGFVPGHEVASLWEGYLYLRRVEQFLQMADDLQTYTLPKGEAAMGALARAMGYAGVPEFRSSLRVKRMSIKGMYNSLLGSEEDVHAEAETLLEADINDSELAGFLEFRGVADTAEAVRRVRLIRAQTHALRSASERAAIRRTVPMLLELALKEPVPDRAITGLENFLAGFGLTEAYLSALTEHRALAEGIVRVLSAGPMLSRLLLGSPSYLNWLIEDMPIRKSLARMRTEAARQASDPAHLAERLVKYRSVEWIRLGMFFLMDVMPVDVLTRYLSHLAEATVGALLDALGGTRGVCVVAMGKLGGRELTFGSDLDLMYVAEGAEAEARVLELSRVLGTHTARGPLYDVDVRLRPDGSKGMLSKDLAGYREYYLKHAHEWEVQALLRCRPIAGNPALGARFFGMSREVLAERGPGVERAAIEAMRERIMRELAKESRGLDIKLGPGGMGAVEFFAQSLQLANAAGAPGVLVQNTTAALGRLGSAGVLPIMDARALAHAYGYYSRLITFLRLNGESVLGPESGSSSLAAAFMGHEEGPGELASHVGSLREQVTRIIAA